MRAASGLLTLLLLASACGSSPQTRFFALEPVPTSAPPRPASGPPIYVSAVHIPPTLDRLELVTLGNDGAVDIRQEERWAAPLDQMSRLVLARDLAERLPEGMIEASDTAKAVGGGRSLVVDLQEFDADATGRVTLDGEWTLSAADRKGATLHRYERIEERERGGNQAATMSEALAQLADRIADDLAANGELPRSTK
jgi:hypothetical protein